MEFGNNSRKSWRIVVEFVDHKTIRPPITSIQIPSAIIVSPMVIGLVCCLQGVPAGPVTKGNDRVSIRSSNISSGTSSDYKAENAALKDRLNVQQKQMACGFLKRAQDKITSSSPDPVEYTKPSSVSLSSSIPLSLDTLSTYADISSYTVSSLDPFGQHFYIPVLVQGFNRTARVSAMIDSGATALFLSHKFAAKHHIPLKKLPHTIKGI